MLKKLNMKTIRILLADDHSIILDGIRAMLESNTSIEIIGEAKNGAEVIEIASKLNPDVIIMDISMPVLSGIEATKEIKKINNKIKIIILTQHENNEYIVQLFKVGADGYLLKNSKKTELLEAIKSVMINERYVGKNASKLLINNYSQSSDKSNDDKKVTLTNREVEIIKMIAEDLSNQEIGEKLKISTRTVETHRRNIMQKLNLKSAVALVRYALQNNLIKLS